MTKLKPTPERIVLIVSWVTLAFALVAIVVADHWIKEARHVIADQSRQISAYQDFQAQEALRELEQNRK